MRLSSFAAIIPLATVIAPAAFALDITSAQSGYWDGGNPLTWAEGIHPLTGSFDSVTIGKDEDGTPHIIIFSGLSNVGLLDSNDLGVSGGQKITIDGGVLSQMPHNFWIRIGHAGEGTVEIKDGRWHFTDSTTGSSSPIFQVGVNGGQGLVIIGDGVGDPGSAVLNLRDRVDGSPNNITAQLNLGSENNTTNTGHIVIHSDGLLEGDDATIRIGQGAHIDGAQSSLTINAGGRFNARGTVEVGVATNGELRANGLLHLYGTDALMYQERGALVVGWHADGQMIIENNATYQKVNTAGAREDIYVGRTATGNGTIVIQSGGTFHRAAGTEVGDLRIGYDGTGSMIINNGGLALNDSGNWDWVGQRNGSDGKLIINEGGEFRSTGSSNLNIGTDAGSTGLVLVNGGALNLQSGSNARLRIGENGNGTFRQVSGTSDVRTVEAGETNGTGTFHLIAGTMNVRGSFFLGGASATGGGTGSGIGIQDGGALTVGGAFVVGLAGNHTGTYNLNAGTITHTGSDVTVGESGTGTMTIAAGAEFHDLSSGQFYVGRNENSWGELYVNGLLTRSAATTIRVGNGNSVEGDNTNGVGVLGGTGTIETLSGVRIGAQGTLTGGTLDSVGALTITGDLTFSPNGRLFANFSQDGDVDRIEVNGFITLETGAILDGEWSGGLTSESDVYWLLVNNGPFEVIGTFANTSPVSVMGTEFTVAPDAFVMISGQEFGLYYSANFETGELFGGNDIAMLVSIPEPSSIALLFGAMAVTLGRRRRKQA